MPSDAQGLERDREDRVEQATDRPGVDVGPRDEQQARAEGGEWLLGDPGLVNTDPYGAGWMIRIRVLDTSELENLMDADAYADHVGE